MSRLKGADLGLVTGADSTATHFKGAWSSATNYAVNDTVTRSFGLYLALTAQSNNDPVAAAGAVSQRGSSGVTPSSFYGVNRLDCDFTVNAATTVSRIDVTQYTASGVDIPVGTTLAITDGAGTSTLASGTTTVIGTNGGMVSAILSSSVTLQPGTSYRVSVVGPAGANTGVGMTNNASTPTGTVATVGSVYINLGGPQPYKMAFALYGPPAAAWQKIANLGADPANAGPAGPTGPAGAAGGGYTRTTATVTTPTLANAAIYEGTIPMALGYRLYHVTTDKAARTRLYTRNDRLVADRARAAGVDPAVNGNSGLMLDFTTTSSLLTADLAPLVDGANLEDAPSVNIPISITNNDVSGPVTVTFTYLRTE